MLRYATLLFAALFVLKATPMNADDAITAAEADPLKVYEQRQFESPDGGHLPYLLLKPQDYDPQQQYPLVLFLHGAGERGDDNQAQLRHGGREMAEDAFRRRHEAFVVAPQCPTNQKWVEVPWDRKSHEMPKTPSEPMRLALELLASIEGEFSIDPARRYAVGLSMGGYGTWDILQREPDLLAAAIPICGGGDPAYADKFAHVPIWAFHGGADPVVVPERSRRMIDALKQAGGTPVYTEYEDVGHDSWSATFANRCVWDWLFAQRRK